MSNFWSRTVTGLSMVFLVLLSLYVSQWMFAAILLLVAILGLLEFYSLTTTDGISPQRSTGTVFGAIWFIISAVITLQSSFWNPFYLIVLPIPFLFLPFVFELWSKKSTPIQNVSITITGMIYLVFPLSLLVIIFGQTQTFFLGMPAFLLGYLLITWIYDTGAYLFGSMFGKTRFFERISPKKTWEGTVSGAICAALVAIGMSMLVPDIPLTDWFILLGIVLAFGTLGDLVESLFKRSLNIKDSGNILPGHGGILDRFDSILLSAPFVFLYFFLRNGI